MGAVLLGVALFLAGLTSCEKTDEQVIRRLVVAEMKERERFNEDAIEIDGIRYASPGMAEVRLALCRRAVASSGALPTSHENMPSSPP